MRAAELTALIRELETRRRDDQRRRRDRRGRQDELDGRGAARVPRRLHARRSRSWRPARRASRKVSVQTGTSHGGVPLPGGGVAEVKLDFDVLRELGEVARAYGLAGAVQHGASTLPDELFHRFPAVETAEIHLATGLPERALRPSRVPEAALKDEIDEWLRANAADERKPGQTEEQFLYTTRKKAIGPFKRQLWDLPTRDEILASQSAKIAFLFTELRVNGTAGARPALRPAGAGLAADPGVAADGGRRADP